MEYLLQDIIEHVTRRRLEARMRGHVHHLTYSVDDQDPHCIRNFSVHRDADTGATLLTYLLHAHVCSGAVRVPCGCMRYGGFGKYIYGSHHTHTYTRHVHEASVRTQ